MRPSRPSTTTRGASGFRVVIVKIVASALTIGSGGSGGREGPTGQISAGFGSLLARELRPESGRRPHRRGDRVSGRGSAPSSAPRSEERSWPPRSSTGTTSTPRHCSRASSPRIVGYVIFGAVGGIHALVRLQPAPTTSPIRLHLVWFALIGILGGLIGLLYAKGFYGIAGPLRPTRHFHRWIKPAIGGVIVGCIALADPRGPRHRLRMDPTEPRSSSCWRLPLWIVLVLPFARILATGLSIGSGGSGGIFGPGMVIGAFIGASVWRLFEPVVPSMGHNPAPYVIVGMMCCFGGISRAPLAVMLMVAEMTGSLSILAPAMIAVGIGLVHRAGAATTPSTAAS